MLCGLKADLKDMREVDEHRAEQLAKSNKISYHEVSNKTGDGVDELF